MANGKQQRFGLQFKVLVTLAVLFTAFSLVAFAWGASFVQDRGMKDAEDRAIALSDQMDAVWDYVDENQPATNVYVKEYGDMARGLVCVTAVKAIARDFSRENESEIHIVALEPRNKEDSPDEFEREALEAFAVDENLEEYSGASVDENGNETYYYLRPRRITAACLSCHGEPTGETDPLGYQKEGLTIGMTKGAVSVREPVGGFTAGVAQSVAVGIGLFLLGLLVVMSVMYALLRATVIKPVQQVSAAASAYRPGRGSKRIAKTEGSDEIAELARDFNAMADDLDSLYLNLEQRVDERTTELELLNDELQEKQKELTRAFDKLQAETESKDRLFASISHDLRTPLASIIATTQLAETLSSDTVSDGSRGAPEEQEALARIGNQARTLVNMVDNILAFSRADAHGLELHPQPVDLMDLAMHMRSTMEPIASQRSITLDVQANPDLPLIEADQNLLTRVLQNLVTNAVKFTPAGGHVRVWIDYAHDDTAEPIIEFVVEDDGMGIAPEDLERIFEPYTKGGYRAGGSNTGAGLGLAVIRQIANVMQGRAWAEQRAEGGSRFVFRFPATVLDEEEYV